jgi:leucyl-tRNA synthetase
VDRPWPLADAAVAKEDELELAVQINGRVRAHIRVSAGAVEDETKKSALEAVRHLLDGKDVASVRVIPGRLVSLVVR